MGTDQEEQSGEGQATGRGCGAYRGHRVTYPETLLRSLHSQERSHNLHPTPLWDSHCSAVTRRHSARHWLPEAPLTQTSRTPNTTFPHNIKRMLGKSKGAAREKATETHWTVPLGNRTQQHRTLVAQLRNGDHESSESCRGDEETPHSVQTQPLSSDLSGFSISPATAHNAPSQAHEYHSRCHMAFCFLVSV